MHVQFAKGLHFHLIHTPIDMHLLCYTLTFIQLYLGIVLAVVVCVIGLFSYYQVRISDCSVVYRYRILKSIISNI